MNENKVKDDPRTANDLSITLDIVMKYVTNPTHMVHENGFWPVVGCASIGDNIAIPVEHRLMRASRK